MKYLSTLAVALFLSFSSFAQGSDAFDLQIKVYQNALKFYDLPTASAALINAYSMKPDKTNLLDSLALVYFASERFAQAATVGEEILKANAGNDQMREVVAVSKQNLGMQKEALSDYETLYKNKKSIFYLYQMATIQYQLKRVGECIASLNQIIADPSSEKEQVSIKAQNGSNQKAPIKAASYNVLGIIALELNKPNDAKSNFDAALKIFPEFELAKNNIKMMEEKEKKDASPATGAKVVTPKK